MRFFLDNNLALQHADALHAYSVAEGHAVVPLRAMFPPNVKDQQWLSSLARESGWIVVSGDLRIFKSPQLKEVWSRSGLTTFFLASGWINLRVWEQAWRLVRWWPQVIQAAALVDAGARFVIPLRWGPGKLKALR